MTTNGKVFHSAFEKAKIVETAAQRLGFTRIIFVVIKASVRTVVIFIIASFCGFSLIIINADFQVPAWRWR